MNTYHISEKHKQEVRRRIKEMEKHPESRISCWYYDKQAELAIKLELNTKSV